jgi:hypothetical protein
MVYIQVSLLSCPSLWLLSRDISADAGLLSHKATVRWSVMKGIICGVR